MNKWVKGILWVIWWSLKGSILVGILTKRIKSEKKRNYVVIAFDIAVIVVFIWWAFNERTSYVQGYTDTLNLMCNKYVIDFCPTWEKMKNMTLEDIQKYKTGMEFNISILQQKNGTYCDSGNMTNCI